MCLARQVPELVDVWIQVRAKVQPLVRPVTWYSLTYVKRMPYCHQQAFFRKILLFLVAGGVKWRAHLRRSLIDCYYSRCDDIWGFPKIRGVPISRIIVFWGL